MEGERSTDILCSKICLITRKRSELGFLDIMTYLPAYDVVQYRSAQPDIIIIFESLSKSNKKDLLLLLVIVSICFQGGDKLFYFYILQVWVLLP